MMKSEKTPDFRAKCVELQAQVEHLLKQEKLLTEKNKDLAQKLSSLHLVKRMMTDDGRYMLVEEEYKTNKLANLYQAELRSAKRKIQRLEKELLRKTKSFDQTMRFQKKEHEKMEMICVKAEASLEHRENDVEILKVEQRHLEDKVKYLKQEIKELTDYKTLAIAEEEERNEQVRNRDMIREVEAAKERKIARQLKEKTDKMIAQKNRLAMDIEKQKKDDGIKKKLICDLKKEIDTLKNALETINTEHSNVDEQNEFLISHLEKVIVDLRSNHENQDTYQQNIINTLNEKILHDSDTITRLEKKESELTDINNSNNQEIFNLKEMIAQLKENNNEVVAERDLHHENWQKAVTKVERQDKMIERLQTKSRQRTRETNVVIEDLAVVKEHHRLVNDRLNNVKRKLTESRTDLNICLTSADNERELAQKKMAEMVSQKEELEKELQRLKALLEDYKAKVDTLKASQEVLSAENAKYKKEQEESEQMRQKYKEVVLKHLKSVHLAAIPNNSQSTSEEIGYISKNASFPLRPHLKLSQLPPISKVASRLQSAPTPIQVSPLEPNLELSPRSPSPDKIVCSGIKIIPHPAALSSKSRRTKSN